MVNLNSTPGQFNARELAEKVGTTVRTVHYYVSEGLLPPPEGTTRNAIYGKAHLARLKIIAVLRAEGLSLAAIRSRLVMLSDDGVVEILQSLERFATELQSGQITALGLIEAGVVDHTVDSADTPAIAESSAPLYPAAAAPPDISSSGSAREYVERMLNRSPDIQPAPSRRQSHVPPKRQPETWHHFSIDDGIEVRIREDRLRPNRRQVEAFVDSVRDIARRTIQRRNS